MKQNALCELYGTCSQARSQPEIFGGQGQNFFVYVKENEGMFVLISGNIILVYTYL